MNVPSWTKPALYGAIVGGIVVAVVGFTWGGWVTGGSAAQSATAAADASRADLAAAVCVQNFLAGDNPREALAALQAETSSFQQRALVEEGGWAVMPDSDVANRQAATLCTRMLMALEPIELPVVEDGEVIEPGLVEEVPVETAPVETTPAEDAATEPTPEVTTAPETTAPDATTTPAAPQ